MSILEEAQAKVAGDRQDAYGSPAENLDRIAKIWSVLLQKEISISQVCQCMVALKLARLVNTPDHRDSWVDIVGYSLAQEDAEAARLHAQLLRAFAGED